jgi:hypothetical protein
VEYLAGETPTRATETVALPKTEQHTAAFLFKMLQPTTLSHHFRLFFLDTLDVKGPIIKYETPALRLLMRASHIYIAAK